MTKLCESGDGKPATRMCGTRCQACYRYYQKHGTFERSGPKPPISIDIVRQNVERAENGCLLWTGMIDKEGRPLYYDGDRYKAGENPLVYVQRWMFEHYAGPLPPGKAITRKCAKTCVAPEHAEEWRDLGKHAFVNNRADKGDESVVTDRCVNGHEMDEANAYVNPTTGVRSCRHCTRDSKLRSRGIDPETVPYQPYRRDEGRCRAGHRYDEVGFDDYGEGRICKECRRIKSAKRNLKINYGLTFQDVARMLMEQNHACATCLRPFTEVDIDDYKMGDVNVDHCHAGGHNRGLLCMDCNIALGKVRDNVDTLAGMIAYLKK